MGEKFERNAQVKKTPRNRIWGYQEILSQGGCGILRAPNPANSKAAVDWVLEKELLAWKREESYWSPRQRYW
jgi:hypothetical protein